ARLRRDRRARHPRTARRDEPDLQRHLRARALGDRVCLPCRGDGMRVHQPGGHLMRERGANVDDWSWQATARRITTLARLTAPYKARTALAILFLLAATGAALAPPYLAKLAIDRGLHHQNLHALWIIAALFVGPGI